GSVVQVDLLVVVSWRERDRTLQLVTQGDEVQVGDVFFRVRGAGGDHTAADVHADSRRDDRPFGGDDGADSASHAEVCIRHERHVRGDDGQGGQVDCLLFSALIEDGCPGQ